MTTCEHSQPLLFESDADISTSSRGGFPVRTSRRQAKARASTENEAASGGNSAASSPDSDPVGCSLRTCLLSELEALTGCSLAWKESATPSGRSWWVLGRSEPRTREIESGSSENWPTPHGMGNDNNPRANGPTGNELGRAVTQNWQTPTSADGGSTSRSGARKGELLLGGQVRQWPTPRSADCQRGPDYGSTENHQGGGNLRAAINNWPTPRAEDSEQTGAHSGTPDTPTSASRQWATPNARDWKDSGPTQGNRKSPNLGTQAHTAGQPDPASPSTNGKSRGCLNSHWVAQLQGYPSDWCDVAISSL